MMIKYKDSFFWRHLKAFEIIFLAISVLFFSVGLNGVIQAEAMGEHIFVFGQQLDGEHLTHEYQVLYSSETAPSGAFDNWVPDDSTFSWVYSPHPESVITPSLSSDYYAYPTGYNSGYIKGYRIYFTYLGDTIETQLNFIGLPYSTIKVIYGNTDLNEEHFKLFKLETDNKWYEHTCLTGVSAFSKDSYGTIDTYSAALESHFDSVYETSATTYAYNYYIEMRFNAVEARYGYPYSDGGYFSGGLKFWLFEEDVPLAVTTFGEFAGDTAYGIAASLFQYHTTFPIADFITAGKTSILFTSNLDTVLTPFLAVFVGNNINQVWAYLATFSLGIYLISVIISFLRRESGHFSNSSQSRKGGKK